MKIALGQINPTIGDFHGNVAKIVHFSRQAQAKGAQVVVFPEMAVCGYPTHDLVENPRFVTRCQQSLNEIAAAVPEISIVCGTATPAPIGTGKSLMNSAVVLAQGQTQFVQSKMLLPTYDVFDECRYFAAAPKQRIFPFCEKKIALTICEDAWNDIDFWHRRLYNIDPVDELIRAGANVILNISASPFDMRQAELRRNMLVTIARDNQVPVVFVNQVGGNDSLIFDGASMVVAPNGSIVAQARQFEEDLVLCNLETFLGDIREQLAAGEATAYAALVLGTRDYVQKCGFQRVVLALSGGIDSALTTVIASDAMGAKNVTAIAMPSQYSSHHSIADARQLADNLGIRFELAPINAIFDEYRKALGPLFAGLPEDVTEENIQSRIRGSILMAFSNKFSALVLSAGNKSELAVGYCTLYGDTVGGLGVISDVPKTLVYRLSHYVNSHSGVIPNSTIEKPPSAELRPGQLDSDALPPYPVLDQILEDVVEHNRPPEQIAEHRRYDLKLVKDIVSMIQRCEYKRQQAAPGLRITSKAFGIGRRLPIAQKWEI